MPSSNKNSSPSELLICTSSNPEDVRFNTLRKQGALIRHSNYDDPASMVEAFSGCEKLFLVSTQPSQWISITPRTEMDEKNTISLPLMPLSTSALSISITRLSYLDRTQEPGSCNRIFHRVVPRCSEEREIHDY